MKFRFSIFVLSHRPRLYFCRGSEVTVGSKEPLQFFLKGIFVEEGSSGTRFDHGQFYSPPHSTCILGLCCMGAVACAVQRFSRAGPRGRGRECATLGVHPLSWLLSNNRLEEVCSTLTKGTFSSRLLLSNQVKGCSPSGAHSLPLPLGPVLLNLSTMLWVQGAHFNFPWIPKWEITCGHSPHRERLAAKPSMGGVQGQSPWQGFRGRSPRKLMGQFSTSKVQENLFRRVKFTRSLPIFLPSVLIMSSLSCFFNPKRAGGGDGIRPPRHFLLYLTRLLFFRAETSWIFSSSLALDLRPFKKKKNQT